MTLPVFLHIEATPDPQERQAMSAYYAKVPSLMRAHGGIPIANYDVEMALDELESPTMFSVVSFPTRESIQQFFDDVAYKSMIPVRDKAFKHLRFFVTSERI